MLIWNYLFLILIICYCSSYFSFLTFAASFIICFKYLFIFSMIMKDVLFCTCICLLEFFIQFHNFKHHWHTYNYKRSSSGPKLSSEHLTAYWLHCISISSVTNLFFLSKIYLEWNHLTISTANTVFLIHLLHGCIYKSFKSHLIPFPSHRASCRVSLRTFSSCLRVFACDFMSVWKSVNIIW